MNNVDNDDDIAPKYVARKQYGIKHPFFHGPNGGNGKSHRKNAAKKKAQHLRNQATRSALYSKFQGSNGSQGVGEWHQTIVALSKGTA